MTAETAIFHLKQFEKRLHMDDTEEYEINTESIDMAIKALERQKKEIYAIRIIDRKTGLPPTQRVIDTIAKKGNLMTMDIDQFFVGEDGQIILVDDCGNAAWCDMKRLKAEREDI